MITGINKYPFEGPHGPHLEKSIGRKSKAMLINSIFNPKSIDSLVKSDLTIVLSSSPMLSFSRVRIRTSAESSLLAGKSFLNVMAT
jgi:hypothetical protein